MRLGVKRKLVGGFVVVNLVFVGLSAYQLHESDHLRSTAIANNAESLKTSDLAATLESSYLKISMTYSQAPGGDPLKIPALAQVIADENKRLNDAMTEFASSAKGAELDQFNKAKASYAALSEAAAKTAQAKSAAEAAALSADTSKHHNEFMANLAALRQVNLDDSAATNEKLDKDFRSDLQITVGLLLALALGCLTFGWRIAKTVSNSFTTGANRLGVSAGKLGATSTRVNVSAEATVVRADQVNETSQEVRHSVNTVSTAMEQMQASIDEIARSTTEASRVAETAMQTVAQTNQRVQTLGASSVEIGKVIEVITSIAEQTNLLALNATIEAARAGDAGKGFAVVANEVKELAKQTAQATEEISARIVAIQEDTNGAVDAIGEISTVMSQISDIQSTIASAIEEQSATTAEISTNIVNAAAGVNDIAGSIDAVASAARDTLGEVSSTAAAAEEMNEIAAGFQNEVDGAEVSGARLVAARRNTRGRFGEDGPAAHEPTAAERSASSYVNR
jgi:methyl-accepting chemotaxis protein